MGRVQPTATSAFRRVLEQYDSTTLFEMADQIDELIQHPGWAVVDELVARGRDDVLKDLVHGPTKDQAAYARQTGYLSGLEEFVNVTEAVRKTAAMRRAKLERQAEAERRDLEEAPA